jgi:hypothetical protein
LTCRTPEMPGHKRNRKPDRSGLELLASCRDGCTEAMMFAHGFTVSQMVNLVRDGLATAYTERVIGGSRATIEIAPLLVQSRDPTSISRRKRRASGLLPQLASLAVPEAEAPLTRALQQRPGQKGLFSEDPYRQRILESLARKASERNCSWGAILQSAAATRKPIH